MECVRLAGTVGLVQGLKPPNVRSLGLLLQVTLNLNHQISARDHPVQAGDSFGFVERNQVEVSRDHAIVLGKTS